MADSILQETKSRMNKSIESLQRELASIRAGVANASILDRIQVEYYGAPTPLNQLASITIPEARMLMISPYDKGSVSDIERAIQASDIGISPNSDGEVIRLVIPALTQERRVELTRVVGTDAENAKISVRNIRRDQIAAAKQLEKNNELTEDEVRRYEQEIQKITDNATAEIDKLAKEKEDEILNN